MSFNEGTLGHVFYLRDLPVKNLKSILQHTKLIIFVGLVNGVVLATAQAPQTLESKSQKVHGIMQINVVFCSELKLYLHFIYFQQCNGITESTKVQRHCLLAI